MLCPNHPNSFTDGILLSVLLRNKLYLLARGDVFSKPMANWALRSMRLLPIYRAKDGAGNEQQLKNQKTFDECYELFKKNGKVLIFPEGICVRERRLRPMKKGASKMAFEAIEKYPHLDLQIMPIGMNYSNPGHFREEVCINFGQPIAAQSFKKLIEEGKTLAAVNEFNTKLYESMEREMVIIKEAANDIVGDQYLIMARNHYKPGFFGFLKRSKKRFLAEKRAANDLNHLSETDPTAFENFRRNVSDYFINLKKIKIKDKYFSLFLYEKIVFLLASILLAVPALVGLLLNFLPIVMAKNTAKKTVKKVEFYDSVFLGAASMINLVYILLLLTIFTIWLGWMGVLVTIAIRLLGFLYLYWFEMAMNTKYWFTVFATAKGRNLVQTLRSQRKFILQYFG